MTAKVKEDVGWPLARKARGWRIVLSGSIPQEADGSRPLQRDLIQAVQDAIEKLGLKGIYLGRLALYVAGTETEAEFKVETLLAEVGAELDRQGDKWGEQNHPLLKPSMTYTSPEHVALMYGIRQAQARKRQVDLDADRGSSNWLDILLEEVEEFAEAAFFAVSLGTPDMIAAARRELQQVAAVATQAMGAIDRALAKEAEMERVANEEAAAARAALRSEAQNEKDTMTKAMLAARAADEDRRYSDVIKVEQADGSVVGFPAEHPGD